METRELLQKLWWAGVDAVKPESCLPPHLDLPSTFERLFVVGAGKASAAMATTLEKHLENQGTRVYGSLVIGTEKEPASQSINMVCGRDNHTNLPTEIAVDATLKMRELLRQPSTKDLVIGLFSGGGSTLICSPVSGISLSLKIKLCTELATRGATIAELNCVRKHLSNVKGGQLTCDAPMLNFYLSDVTGDDLSTVASGPTVPDPTTVADAASVIQKYKLDFDTKLFRETPKSLRSKIINQLIGNNELAQKAIVAAAKTHGLKTICYPKFLSGSTKQAAQEFYEFIEHQPSGTIVVAGGETTTELCQNPGLGGRNQEFALYVQKHLQQTSQVYLLAAGTDGEDGPTDVAGAFAISKKALAGPMLDQALANNNSYSFCKNHGLHFKSGPTGTNVADIVVAIRP